VWSFSSHWLLHVALAPGEILGVPGVHQVDLKAPRVEDFIQRNPVDAGRLLDARWWAHLVGALRVHPHQHCAKYPSKKIEDLREAGAYIDRKFSIAR